MWRKWVKTGILVAMDEAIQKNSSTLTRRALFLSSLLQEPLFTLYGFLIFILYKDLHASAFQIALLTMLRPIVSILSFYWSARSGGRLRTNMLWAGIWMRAPFLLCLWFDSAWFVIVAAVNYMLFYRAGTPAWMEILRRNLKQEERSRAFSMSSAVGYGEGVLLSMAMGAMLDHDPGLWKVLLFGASLLGLFATAMQARVPVIEEEVPKEKPSWKELVVQPWQDSIALLRKRRDFAIFQWGFMICGLAIMLIKPALPIFAVDELGISYTQMAGAISIAQGLGYVVSSPLWGRWMARLPIHRLASGVFCIMALFPLLLVLSKWQLFWFYIAYFWYGVGREEAI